MSVHAKTDATIGIEYQGFPVGAVGVMNMGLGYRFWEKTDSKVLYGYVRPSLDLMSAFLYNRAEGAIDFYPVSFAGLTMGRGLRANHMPGSTVDCKDLACNGRLEYRFFRSKNITWIQKNFFLSRKREKVFRGYWVHTIL